MGSWKFAPHKSAKKWQTQLQQRGWTPEQITEAIDTGRRYPATNRVHQANTASVVDLKFPSFRWQPRLGTSNPNHTIFQCELLVCFRIRNSPEPGPEI